MTIECDCSYFGCSNFQMVKEKPNSTRIYDKDGFRRRAACICVKSENEAEVSNNSQACLCNLKSRYFWLRRFQNISKFKEIALGFSRMKLTKY